MKKIDNRRFWRPVAFLVSSALSLGSSTGCATGIFNGYEAQDSVEDSLVRHPTNRVAIDSVPSFSDACSANDAGACSALGVSYEVGIGHAGNARAARDAYSRACSLGNGRGCANLATLMISGALGAPDLTMVKVLFESACNAGERSGCAQLGRLYRDGHGAPKDTIHALSLLETACAAGETSACVDMAALVAIASPDHVMGLYVRACLGGYQPACERVEEQTRPAAAGQPFIAAR